MKHIYLIYFFVIGYTLNAQAYKPLVEENRYWVYQTYDSGDHPCDKRWVNKAEIHHFGSDTLINNISYHKILNSQFQLIGQLGNPDHKFDITSTIVMGYIREDTLTKKVFVIPKTYHVYPCLDEYEENLLFDFSLNEGDSINECLAFYVYKLNGQFDYPIIDSIRYESDPYGTLRKHFFSFGYFDLCNFNHVQGYILEGFGFKDGPFRGHPNRELISYCEGTLEDCRIIKSNVNDDIDFKPYILNVFPNPGSDIITIHTDYEPALIQIFDVQGMKVKTAYQKEINISDLPAGLYFVNYTTHQKSQLFGKLIRSAY